MFLSFDINYILQINTDRLAVLFHKDVVLPLLSAFCHWAAAESAQHGAGGNGTVPHPVYHVPGDQ